MRGWVIASLGNDLGPGSDDTPELSPKGNGKSLPVISGVELVFHGCWWPWFRDEVSYLEHGAEPAQRCLVRESTAARMRARKSQAQVTRASEVVRSTMSA